MTEEWVAWWFHDGRLAWVNSYPTWSQAQQAVVEQVERLWVGCGTEDEWRELHTELCTACSRDWTGSSASAMDSFSVFQATPVLADIFIGNIRPHLGALR